MSQGLQRISANRHRPGDQDFSENGISLFTARETEALDSERLPKGPTDLGLELTLGISPLSCFSVVLERGWGKARAWGLGHLGCLP